MSVSMHRSGVWATIFLLSGMGVIARAETSAQLYIKGGVSASTCDFASAGEPALNVRRYPLSELLRPATGGSEHDVFTLHFPDVRCRTSLLGDQNPLIVTISGPAAKGAGNRAWGSQYEDMAYGIRLRHQQGRRLSGTALSPVSNRLVIQRPGWYGYPDDDVSVVIRLEFLSWDRARVRRGAALAVPLIFSVSYQ